MSFKPRILVYKDSIRGDCLISVRWLKTGFDLLKGKENIFIQAGRKPVKFLYLSFKATRPPMFLLNHHWKTTFRLRNLRVGITSKPLDLLKPWRTQWAKSSSDQNANTTTTLIRIASSTR